MEALNFKLEQFEGPLDMLLHLVARNKVDICDISIVELIDQYMYQIELIQSHEMDISSEFLDMAARLIFIKTVSLLPKHEEAKQLEQELKGQLIEYSICKLAAKNLAKNMSGFDYFTKPAMIIEQDKTYQINHMPNELLEAYINVSGKKIRRLPPNISEFQPIVAEKNVTVSSRVVCIMDKLRSISSKSIDYVRLFDGITGRSELVSTFMAVLELIKSGFVVITEEDDPVIRLINSNITDDDIKKITADED